MALAEGKATRDPILSRILFTRKINHYLGVQIWPEEVDELSEDFIDAINGLISGVPMMTKHFNEVEDVFKKFRAAHPTYNKYR